MENKGFYLTTLSASTAITNALAMKLTTTHEHLVVVKNNVLEIYEMNTNGLDSIYRKQFPYSIHFLTKYKPNGMETEMIVLITSNQEMIIATLKVEEQVTNKHSTLELKAKVSLEEHLGRNAFYGISGIVYHNEYLLIHNYNHTMKAIKLPTIGTEQNGEVIVPEVQTMRINEQRIISIQMLNYCGQELIVFHNEVANHKRIISCYTLVMNENEITLQLFENDMIETINKDDISMIIPYHFGTGFFVVQGQKVVYHFSNTQNKTYHIQCIMNQITLETFCFIEPTKLLLMDNKGKIHLITLKKNASNNNELFYYPLEYQPLSIPSLVLYLDNSVLFWVSKGGNSHLIRINGERLDILETFENRGPILDMKPVHDEITQKDDLLLCSNTFHQGNLKLLSSGIGIDILCASEMPNIKRIFSFEASGKQYVVISYVEHTRIFECVVTSEEFDMTEQLFLKFRSTEETFFCGLVDVQNNDMEETVICQVTSEEINLFNIATFEHIKTIHTNGFITHTKVFNNKLYFTTMNSVVELTSLNGTGIEELFIFDKSISAFTVCDINNEPMILLSYWEDSQIEFWNNNTKTQVKCKQLYQRITVKSIEIVRDECMEYSLVLGMGNGQVRISKLGKTIQDEMEMESCDPSQNENDDDKILEIGMSAIELLPITLNGISYILCLCDKPRVISITNNKIESLTLISPEITTLIQYQFSNKTMTGNDFNNCLLYATKEELIFGNINEVESIHTKTLPLHQFVSRIVISKQSMALLLCSEIQETATVKREVHSIQLINFKKMNGIEYIMQLEEYEHALSIEQFSIDGNEMFVIGTAYAKPNEIEPSNGRLIIVEIKENRLVVLYNKQVKGAVYSIKTLLDKYLAMTIEKKLYVFEYQRTIQKDTNSLQVELVEKSFCNVKLIGLYVKTLGNLILVGDLMKSISVYSFTTTQSTSRSSGNENTLREICRDYYSSYTTSVEFIDPNHYLSTDANSNLFIFKSHLDSPNESERFRLTNYGQIHLSECINVACKASLVSHGTRETILFGSVTGYLGGLVEITSEEYELLLKIQHTLLRNMNGLVSCQNVDEWKKVIDDWKKFNCQNVIDGYIVENFLNLSIERQRSIAEECQISHKKCVEVIDRIMHYFH